MSFGCRSGTGTFKSLQDIPSCEGLSDQACLARHRRGESVSFPNRSMIYVGSGNERMRRKVNAPPASRGIWRRPAKVSSNSGGQPRGGAKYHSGGKQAEFDGQGEMRCLFCSFETRGSMESGLIAWPPGWKLSDKPPAIPRSSIASEQSQRRTQQHEYRMDVANSDLTPLTELKLFF
jgi:hypothetical protein